MGGSGSIIAMIKSMEANRKMMRGGYLFSKKSNSYVDSVDGVIHVSRAEAKRQRLALKEKVAKNVKTKVITTLCLITILAFLVFGIVQMSYLF